MRIHRGAYFLGILAVLFLSIPSYAKTNDHSQRSQEAKSSGAPKSTAKNGLKPFDELIKDREVVEGLFTFYRDTTDNSLLMSVKPDQLGVCFLLGLTLSHGDGNFREGSRMFGTYPFYFKRVGKKMMMMEKNLKVRADSTAAMFGAVESGISDGLIASTAVKSEPQDSTEAVLIDPTALFIRDALNLGYFVGTRSRNGLRFDSKNSYFGETKSFEQNSEIDVHLHYTSSQPLSGVALQNSYSFFHTFHYSLSALPESDYIPRLADDRVGYFLTIYQDYNQLDQETPYVRYIERWNLKKEFPTARISDPIEPIIYWIENTVPAEYRDAIAEGIEFWNQSFEKIGFRNAIQAKIMPDTSSWDPSDVRYSTVRWLVAKNYPYVAIGTSRSNPFTGEVFDADIGFVSEAIRALFARAERRVRPLSDAFDSFEEYDPYGEILSHEECADGRSCNMAAAAYEASFGMAYLNAMAGDFENKDEITEEYIKAFLTFVVAHEVGHTLGFRHNFSASTLYSLDEINDPDFMDGKSYVGTVMEYVAPNVAGPGKTQGEYYPSKAGPYDDWLIEYGYSQFDAETPEDELPMLQEIASRAAESGLIYHTDYDTYGTSMKGVDPRANIWDLGDDPIAFLEHEIGLSQEIWNNLITEFEKPGERYHKIRNVFNTSLAPYTRASLVVPKFVGGLYVNRYHVGDAEGVLPFEVVPASEQRRAVKFLRDHLFSADVLDLPSDLINKLQDDDMSDFTGHHYRRASMDFPLHRRVLTIQNSALSRLYSPYVVHRMLNNLKRFKPGEDRYTMYDLFADVRRSIWGEIVGPENVNSFRRQLQLIHLNRMINIYLSGPSIYPTDARTLAANDLDILEEAAKRAIKASSIDGMTKAHFKEVLRQIESAKRALRTYSRG
ncbi:MAG: DUF5117 domain-containing protein [bacterium]|nr:DUF5117 domain-containing protein [bacterium]